VIVLKDFDLLNGFLGLILLVILELLARFSFPYNLFVFTCIINDRIPQSYLVLLFQSFISCFTLPLFLYRFILLGVNLTSFASISMFLVFQIDLRYPIGISFKHCTTRLSVFIFIILCI